MLADVVDVLACPVCARGLTLGGRALACAAGHAFDVARQGYVSLLPPGAGGPGGDSAEMVAARAAFLGAGHYAPLTARLAAAAQAGAGDGVVLEVGAGTAHHLAAVLDALGGERAGVALDRSRPAARRAARAHPRVGAVVADAWARLPLRDAAAGLVLDVFAPRRGPELRRVLRPDGALVVVTPTAAHLRELVAPLGLVRVDERKEARLREELAADFALADRVDCAWAMVLGTEDARALVAMGPSARHLAPEALAAGLTALDWPLTVTAATTVWRFAPR